MTKRERLRAMCARSDVRFACAAAALLIAAVVAQGPAAERAAKARIANSAFVAGGDAELVEIARSSDMMYLPEKEWLYFASLGNAPLAADAVWIKSAGYVTREFNSKYEGTKFEWLKKLYTTVFELDPRWEQSSYIGAMVLGAVGRDSAGAVKLLRRAMLVNPDSWQLPYQAGVTCLLWPGHSQEALSFFQEAVRRPGHPPVIEEALPRLMSEAGRLEQAMLHARSRLYVADMPAFSRGTVVQLAELVSQQLQTDLERAAKRFRADRGRWPLSLSELRRAGTYMRLFDRHYVEEPFLFEEWHARLGSLIAQLGAGAPTQVTPQLAAGLANRAVIEGRLPAPEKSDPYGLPFLYHAPSGTVRAQGLGIVEVNRTSSILQAAANYQYRNGTKQWARNLEELAGWYRNAIAGGRTFPQDWSQRIGDGRPPEHPFAAWGEHYPYDPQTGRITVPEKYAAIPQPLRALEMDEGRR